MAAALIVLAWAALLLGTVAPAIAGGRWATSSYWVAPQLVIDDDVARLYDADGFRAAATERGAAADIFDANPPITALLLLPVGLLPEAAALGAWTVLGVAALAASWAALVRVLALRGWALVLAAVLPPLFAPVRLAIDVGQAFLFVLALGIVGVIASATRDGPGGRIVGGLAFGVLACLKSTYGLAMLAVAAVRRPWVALIGGATVVAGIAVAAAVMGPGPWIAWWRLAIGWRDRPESIAVPYQTVHAWLGQLLRPDPTWSPGAPIDGPGLLTPLWLAAAIVIAAMTVVALLRVPRDGSVAVRCLPWAMAIPPTILLGPIAEDYHVVLALLPIAVAIALTTPGRPGWWPWLLGAVIVLLAGPWPFETLGWTGWAVALLFPRVYGLLLLWALLVHAAWRAPRPATASVAP